MYQSLSQPTIICYYFLMKIICPVCKNELIKIDKQYVCSNRHSYDIAKEGYVNLNLKSSTNTGDEKEMIKARKSFLEKDYYKFLKDELIGIIKENNPDNMIDLACGEGYYTKDFPVTEKIGIDLSKEALKLASKTDKSTRYILKNIFDIPFVDSSIDLVTTIFAPISTEINRVLKNNGYFILVKPDIYHLYELKEVIYDNPYVNEVEKIKINGLKLIKEKQINNKVLLNNEDLINLFKMTPYYHKTSPADINKLNNINELSVSFSFIIDIYKKDVTM